MLKKSISLLSFLYSLKAFAWSDHTITTYYTLKNVSSQSLQNAIPAETLENFLIDMKKNHPGALKASLEVTENWAMKRWTHFHTIPQNIFYDETKGSDSERIIHFLNGIRVNPHVFVFPYLRDLPASYVLAHAESAKLWNTSNEIAYTKVTLPSILSGVVPGLRYFSLNSSQLVPALAVLATAADEPDLGLDISLFENNNSEFGKYYQFGNQPFGDERVSFASAAPFHYGAYHEWSLFYALAPQTKECYAMYRIKMYRELARVAFSSGHIYWGWRFLGMGLHYIQDLTQPYHAKFFPGYNTLMEISYYGFSMLNVKKPLENSINLVANRHFLFEDFVYRMLQNSQLKESAQLQSALASPSNNELNNLEYNDDFPQQVISFRSNSLADNLSSTIEENFPSHYVNDPSYLYSDKEVNILEVFKNLDITKQHNILNMMKPILENTGIYTRAYLQEFLK